MDEMESLSHTKWECKYHVVLIPKCRRKTLYGALNHGGFKMSCDLSEILQRQFYFFGTYLVEEDILRCWESAAKGARFIFDVGAKAGIYSLAALAIQPDATVHAFEPTPEIAVRLREAAKLNGILARIVGL